MSCSRSDAQRDALCSFESAALARSSSFSAFSHFNTSTGSSLEPLLQLPANGGKGKQQQQQLLSLNAYIGAVPIAAALDRGATIVVTGRCVDSALVVAPLIHECECSETEASLQAQD